MLRLFPVCLGLALASVTSSAAASEPDHKAQPSFPGLSRTIFTAPGILELPGQEPLAFENGFLLVPENRSKPDSRLIAVRFLRFRASATPSQVPVLMLPGGPGTLADEAFIKSRPSLIAAIRHTVRTRDFWILQQRGIADGAYATSPTYPVAALPANQLETDDIHRERLRNGVRAGLARWADRGIDLSGYTVPELVADIEDLRMTLGADRLALFGGSFGSQWSFAYLRSHQDHVARVVLTGVEPLDYGWDDPQAIWATLGRISDYAKQDPAVAHTLPKGGLQELYRRVIARLEKLPVAVQVSDPKTAASVTVRVGADDLRSIRYPVGGSRRAAVEAWPQFLTTLDRGDYRPLAQIALRKRQATDDSLLGEIIDTSLGITPEREAKLQSRIEARRWVGNPNQDYAAVRDLLPGRRVEKRFLEDFTVSVPMLILQGDLDLSTPLENVQEQQGNYRDARIIIVNGATHDIKEELVDPKVTPDPAIFEAALQFLSEGDEHARSSIPPRVNLRPFSFQGAGKGSPVSD